MTSKISKQLLKLLKKRKDVAKKLNSLDADVEKIFIELNIANTPEYATLQNDYGCMLTTEPETYYNVVVDFLEKQIK